MNIEAKLKPVNTYISEEQNIKWLYHKAKMEMRLYISKILCTAYVRGRISHNKAIEPSFIKRDINHYKDYIDVNTYLDDHFI